MFLLLYHRPHNQTNAPSGKLSLEIQITHRTRVPENTLVVYSSISVTLFAQTHPPANSASCFRSHAARRCNFCFFSVSLRATEGVHPPTPASSFRLPSAHSYPNHYRFSNRLICFVPLQRTRKISLKLQITHCTGLAKADRFGLSDPFCVVKWPRSDRELGKTPTVYNTVHPMWQGCFFELPLETPTPAAPASSAVDERGDSPEHWVGGSGIGGGGDGGGGGAGNIRGGDGDGGGSGGRDDAGRSGRSSFRKNVGAARGTGGGKDTETQDDGTIELMVQVWDEDEGVATDFLGELKFDAQALLEMARGQLELVNSSTCM